MNRLEIRDPIHGTISLDETEAAIIDTPEMQRLRYLKQLDTSYLIFPGANHTRFEHSLGTMHVTRELAESIGKDSEASYAGLLHDIGHGPFSHLTEFVSEKYMRKNHEQWGLEVIKDSEIPDILSAAGLPTDRILSYFTNSDSVGIVGGTLGSDRLDYLMRDSHYTGVAYGVIDYDRVKSTMVPHKDGVAILESGISGAESVLIARYFMHSNIYSHHAKIIAAMMLRKAIVAYIESESVDPEKFMHMNDGELIMGMSDSKSGRVRGTVSRIMQRRLFKRAFYEKIGSDIDESEIESAIEGLGLANDEFIVHSRSLGGSKDNIDVIGRNGEFLGTLVDLSPFVKTLMSVLAESKTLMVACDGKNVEMVGKAVRKLIG